MILPWYTPPRNPCHWRLNSGTTTDALTLSLSLYVEVTLTTRTCTCVNPLKMPRLFDGWGDAAQVVHFFFLASVLRAHYPNKPSPRPIPPRILPYPPSSSATLRCYSDGAWHGGPVRVLVEVLELLLQTLDSHVYVLPMIFVELRGGIWCKIGGFILWMKNKPRPLRACELVSA